MPLFSSSFFLVQEELEEGASQVYDDYKFVTREELERLGLSELLGSTLLRPFMHGFFIHSRLYHKVQCCCADRSVLLQCRQKSERFFLHSRLYHKVQYCCADHSVPFECPQK